MSEPLEPTPGEEWHPFAAGAIRCPRCSEVLPVPVVARLIDYLQPGGGIDKMLETQPELGDVWAHWWTHGTPATQERP